MIDPTSIHMKTHMFFYLHQSKLNDIAHDSMQKRNNFSIFLPIIISSQNWIQESKKYEEEKTLFLLGFEFFLFSPLSLYIIYYYCVFSMLNLIFILIGKLYFCSYSDLLKKQKENMRSRKVEL